MSILLKNATYIDELTFEFISCDLLVGEHLIFNPKREEVANVSEILDCTGKYVTRSFVCGHHHIYSALARGMGAPKKKPENFYEILKYIWWTLDKCLDKEMIEASAYLTAAACAKNGVTFIIDHHASPGFIEGSLSVIAEAIEKVGLSHLLCYEITDRDGIDKAEAGLAETDSYLTKKQGLVGLHASFTVGNSTLEKAVELAKKHNSGIHIHVAEDKYDQQHCEEHYNMRVVERLNKAGVLDFPKTILGHCLHLNDNERILLRESKAWVVQNTESNLKNKVGFFSSKGLSDRIMLGTDGMHSDMLRSAKAAFFVGQNFDSIDYSGVYQRFRNADRYLRENNIKGHEENNLVVLDYLSPTDFNSNNFLGHFLYGLESRCVQHVISKGKLIVKDGHLLTINEAEIAERAKMLSVKLWEKMAKI